MTLDERPLVTLTRLVERHATGEMICASPRAEVHVFLQHGRIAWATDSEHPFAFTRHLQRTAQLDADAFRDILESCRRERRQLGETLVSWGVATPEEVRDALRHQIELALEVLATGGPAQALFLDRTEQFARYDASLTFDLADLLRRGAAEVTSAPPPGAPVATSTPPASRALSPRKLIESVDGVAWAERLDGTRVVDAAPEPSAEPRFAREVATTTLLDEAELVVLRSPVGTLAGAAAGAQASLWCRLSPDCTVGTAMAALSGFASNETRPGSEVGDAGDGKPWVVGAGPALAQIEDFFARAPETLAALVTEREGEPWSCGMGSPRVAPDWALSLVRRRARALAVPKLFDDETHAVDDENGVGFCFRTLVTREARVWCFGAELETSPRRLLWVLLARRSSQGIGWAYLTSLSRQLLHIRNWERHG